MGGKRKRKAQICELSDEGETQPSSTRHVSIAVRRRGRTKAKVSNVPISSGEALPTPSSNQTEDQPAPPCDAFDDPPEVNLDEDIIIVPDQMEKQGGRRSQKKRKRRIHHLKEFADARDTILDELLRHDGIGEQTYPTICAKCKTSPADMNCIDCTSAQLSCASCICKQHAEDPLHRTQRWNGWCFESYSLAEAGLVTQLGHDDQACPHPHETTSDLTVLDMTRIHTICVRYCDCARLGSHRTYLQLLRTSWWPVTLERPQTVVTICTLKLFHALTLQAKMNAYDFYHGIVRITDGSSLKQPKSRYHEFSRAARCFRHLRMAKRSGRGHDSGGVTGTPLGALGLDCPACPHPGLNLPEGWEAAPPHLRFLYTMFLSIDANFKLKLKNHGYADIELAPGWAYFVPDRPYASYLSTHKAETEIKTCDSTFAAIDHANGAGQKRFAINGVGAVICGRHSFFRRNGVGDLERGERYANIDFILVMSMFTVAELFLILIISYDIACQYSKRFDRRMEQFPDLIRIDTTHTKFGFLVPKFHLAAHGADCQVNYSFNFTEGVGRTYGEGIEANWSETNGASLSTREMSSGARHKALDDIFGAMNWRKTTSMGTQLARMLKDAVEEYAKQQLIFEDLKQTFPEEICALWDAAIKEWDEDKTKPNPYEEPVNETTLADVRLELSQEEARLASQGHVSLHEMTASTFLSVGLELQEQQRALRKKDGNVDKDTSTKKVTLQDRRNTLQHRIKAWRKVQAIYMPVVSTLIPADSDTADSVHDTPKPEFEKLWMPSDVPAAFRESGMASGLASKELRLRIAEAKDALHQVHRMIRIRLGLRHYKNVHVEGPSQQRNSRARNLIKKFTERRDRQYERYNDALRASDLLESNPEAAWRIRLRPMKKSDLVDPTGNDSDDEDDRSKKKKKKQKQKLGEGRKEVPWIWRVFIHDARDHPQGDGAEMSAEEIYDGMRVTYARSRARVRRWKEEISFVLEEMRRVVDTLQKRAGAWQRRVDVRLSAPCDIRSGLCAYATRQHLLHDGLATAFKALWVLRLAQYNLTVNWPATQTFTLPPPPRMLSDSDQSFGQADGVSGAVDPHQFKLFRAAAALSISDADEGINSDESEEHGIGDIDSSDSEDEM